MTITLEIGPEIIVSLRRIAEAAGLSHHDLARRALMSGELKGIQIGPRAWVAKRADCEEFAAGRRAAAAAA
jgi:hypothetical protein